MTRDDVIRMARLCDLGRVCGPLDTLLDDEWESLHRFAALVAAAEREAVIQDAVQHAYIKRTLVDQFSEFIRARGTP